MFIGWDYQYIPHAPVLGRLGKRVEIAKATAELSMTGKGK